MHVSWLQAVGSITVNEHAMYGYHNVVSKSHFADQPKEIRTRCTII